jgi:peptidoglycan/LPS O-acetylase OafA/YrhL
MGLAHTRKSESPEDGAQITGKAVADVGEKVQSPTGPRIVFLDTLRFIAAAAVVFQHVIEIDGPSGAAIAAALSPGVFGVVLFFIISGFVIPMAAKRGLDLRKFVVRRIFRIYPLVLVTFALLAVTAYSGLLPGLTVVREASLRVWLANLLLVQDYVGVTTLWGVTWTLSLEVAWYTIFALTLTVVGQRFDDWLAVIAPVLLLSLVLLSLATGHRLPLARFGMIYAAILGARIYRHQIGFVSLRRVLVDLGIFLVVMAVSNIVAFGYFRHPSITMNQALYPWLAAPCLFAFVALVPRVRQAPLVNSDLIAWLGAISFSIYLLHPLAIDIALSYAPSGALTGVSLGLTLMLSVLGYYLVEVPGQRLGHWICDALPKPARSRSG